MSLKKQIKGGILVNATNMPSNVSASALTLVTFIIPSATQRVSERERSLSVTLNGKKKSIQIK